MATPKENSTNNLNRRYIVTCDMTYALNLIGGRWKLLILTQLEKGALRFGELKKRIPQVTERMLTLQLREMEAEGIVKRTVYPEVPPRVEYALTTISERLLPICHQLSEWGTEHRQAHQVPA